MNVCILKYTEESHVLVTPMLALQSPRQIRTATAISKEVENPKAGMQTVDATSPANNTGRRPAIEGGGVAHRKALLCNAMQCIVI